EVARSYTSASETSSGPIPASSYAVQAIESMNVRGGGSTDAALSDAKYGISSTVFGKRGVTVSTPLTLTALLRPIARAFAGLTITTAAPPSDVAQMSSRWSGSET